MLTFFRANIETRLTVSEITARIQSRTFEADPNKWWSRDNIADKRWVGLVTYEKFILRRPYMTEGFFHPRLAGFYRQIGFNGAISDKERVRTVTFAAVLRPQVALGYGIMLVVIAVFCLLTILVGNMLSRVGSMLFLGVVAFSARYMWWGFSACAKAELRYLGEMLDTSVEEEPPSGR